MSIISTPPCLTNSTPDLNTLRTTGYDPCRGKLDFSMYLDPTLIPGHIPMAYRESGWSPAGCDIIGGYINSS